MSALTSLDTSPAAHAFGLRLGLDDGALACEVAWCARCPAVERVVLLPTQAQEHDVVHVPTCEGCCPGAPLALDLAQVLVTREDGGPERTPSRVAAAPPSLAHLILMIAMVRHTNTM